MEMRLRDCFSPSRSVIGPLNFFVVVLGVPKLFASVVPQRKGIVVEHIYRKAIVVDGSRVHEGFERGPRLPLGLGGAVEFAVA